MRKSYTRTLDSKKISIKLRQEAELEVFRIRESIDGDIDKPSDALDRVNIVGKEIHGAATVEELEVIDIEFTQDVDGKKLSSNSRENPLTVIRSEDKAKEKDIVSKQGKGIDVAEHDIDVGEGIGKKKHQANS